MFWWLNSPDTPLPPPLLSIACGQMLFFTHLPIVAITSLGPRPITQKGAGATGVSHYPQQVKAKVKAKVKTKGAADMPLSFSVCRAFFPTPDLCSCGVKKL